MSDALTDRHKPSPTVLLPAPRFNRTGLPITSAEVARNVRQQSSDARCFAGSVTRASVRRSEEMPPPCSKTLHLSLCFDGTNNHEPSDKNDPLSTSNVARLFHASIDRPTLGYFGYYSPGVGTVFEEIKEYVPNSFGLMGAQGGENRINWGLTRVVSALKELLTKEPLLLSETQGLVEAMSTNWSANVLSGGLLENGSSKRAAAMRPYEQELRNRLEQRRAAQKKPDILALRLYVYGFSRGAAQARTFANWLAGRVAKVKTAPITGLPGCPSPSNSWVCSTRWQRWGWPTARPLPRVTWTGPAAPCGYRMKRQCALACPRSCRGIAAS